MILENMKYGRIRHLTLIDPEKSNFEQLRETVELIEKAGSDGILVGGSTGIRSKSVDDVVTTIKKFTRKPVILFPSSPEGVSPNADAIFFLSLLNSTLLKFVVGYQVASARLLMKSRMEVVSVAYLIFEPGMTVGRVGKASLIKRDDISKALDYASAAELMGFKAIYLEAGSGADQSIDEKLVRSVCKEVSIPVIVGGGIRDSKTAQNMIRAGASAVVTGTVTESNPELLTEIVAAIKN